MASLVAALAIGGVAAPAATASTNADESATAERKAAERKAILSASVPPPAMTGARRLPKPRGLGRDVQRIRFRYGPVRVTPGQNWIDFDAVTSAQKPGVDGYITRMKADLVDAGGKVPPSDRVMFHHGGFANLSAPPVAGFPVGEPFYALGEEKTIVELPQGYGYPVRKTDEWFINYMIHNLIPQEMSLYIIYDLDVVPANTPTGRRLRPARPVFMDVEGGSLYPVFDVLRGSGGKDGRFTYPDDANRPYGDGPPKNVWTSDRDGVLVWTSGHLHQGGLHNDLYIERGDRSRLAFRARAKYFEPRGPVSWDMSMYATKPNWRVRIRKGDRLRTTATYETKRASWYESMGIQLVYIGEDKGGVDPFKPGSKIDTQGRLTHGHLPENDVHGGSRPVYPDPTGLPSAAFPVGDMVNIDRFAYGQGDLVSGGRKARPPVIRAGQSLTFQNLEGDTQKRIYHTITSCKAPCNKDTGIAYPIPDGPVAFDSGELGYGPPGLTAAANRITWETPKDLRPGTYTYFCRIHPFMRGAFRVAS